MPLGFYPRTSKYSTDGVGYFLRGRPRPEPRMRHESLDDYLSRILEVDSERKAIEFRIHSQ